MITIPRYLRPHEFTVNIKGEEDEKGIAKTDEVFIKYVKIDTSYGIKQSQKGIGRSDSVQILIDLSDFVAFKNGKAVPYGLAGINKNAMIIIHNEEYTITKIIEASPLSNNPCFVEVYANG